MSDQNFDSDGGDRELPDVSEISDGMRRLMDAYESRYLMESQTTELDILRWVNGVEVMLKEIVAQVGLLTVYVGTRDA